MRVLVIGAGALGGYFGTRLIEAGRDVTFLVRPRRASELGDGLVVKSPAGDITIAKPQLVTADQLETPFDLILLSCKAYDLESAMDSFAPAVGPQTLILPLLNGRISETGVPTIDRSWLPPTKEQQIDLTLTRIAQPTMTCIYGQ